MSAQRESGSGLAGAPASATGDPAKAWMERDGALLRLRLDRPKANILDAAMVEALRRRLDLARSQRGLRGVLIDATGPHFSFGASVEEHLPDRCAAMLRGFHALILDLLGYPAPVLVAVRGQCLGGGLEVALAGSLIFAGSDAELGQPEIRLGVIAPAASCLLRYRVSQGTAEDILLSGRSLGASEAHARGLVQAVSDDPEAAALAYFDAHLRPRSASSLALALAAARAPMISHVQRRLADVEALYLERLMPTHDAREGLDAFLAKRQPNWEHR